MGMKVWIDQDLCTGDGLCEEIAPDVFTLLDDGLAYVKEGSKVFSDPGGVQGLAAVPAGMEEATIESAALADPKVRTYAAGKQVSQVIIVPGRLVNVVVK